MCQAWKVGTLPFYFMIEFKVLAILKLVKISKLNFDDMLFISKESNDKKSWSYSAHFFVIWFVLFLSQEFGSDIFTFFKMAITLNWIKPLLYKVKWKNSNFPSLPHFLSRVLFNFTDIQKLERESRLCRKVQHPNIGKTLLVWPGHHLIIYSFQKLSKWN